MTTMTLTSTERSRDEDRGGEAGADVVVGGHVDGVVVAAGEPGDPERVGERVGLALLPLPALAPVVDGVAEDRPLLRPHDLPRDLEAGGGRVAREDGRRGGRRNCG